MLSTRLFWICVAILLGVAFIGAPVTGSQCEYYCNSDTRNISTTIDTDCERGCTPGALCHNWNSFSSTCLSDATETRYQWFAGVLYPERSINGESCSPTLELRLIGLSIPAGGLRIRNCHVHHDLEMVSESYSVTVRGVSISTYGAYVAEVSGSCMNGAVAWTLNNTFFTFNGVTSENAYLIYYNNITRSICAYTYEEF